MDWKIVGLAVAIGAGLFGGGWYLGHGGGSAAAVEKPVTEKKAAGPAAASPPPAVVPAAAAVAPAPVAVASKPEDAPYAVQLGSFLEIKLAKDLQGELKDKGYSAFLFQWTDGNFRQWYAVRVGGFGDVDAAAEAAKEFRVRDRMLALVRRNGEP